MRLEVTSAPSSRERPAFIRAEFRLDQRDSSDLSRKVQQRRTPKLRHPRVRDRDDKFAALFAILLLLLRQNLVGEVPSQQQAVIGAVGQQLVGIMYLPERPCLTVLRSTT